MLLGNLLKVTDNWTIVLVRKFGETVVELSGSYGLLNSLTKKEDELLYAEVERVVPHYEHDRQFSYLIIDLKG